MKIPVEKAIVIEDGKHEGIIVDVIYRTEPYKYTDLVIEFNEGLQIKSGYPTKMMEESKLGLLLKRFGIVVAEGLEVDPDMLKGKACQFITMTEQKDKGHFARVIADSVRPVEEQMSTTPVEAVQ